MAEHDEQRAEPIDVISVADRRPLNVQALEAFRASIPPTLFCPEYPTIKQAMFLMAPHREVFFGGAAGPGKLLNLETPIPTPSGWTSNGNLEIGDEIFDEQGAVCRVTGLSQIDYSPESYRLTFDNGETQLACADHQWLTYDAKELAQLTKRDEGHRARRRAGRPQGLESRKSKSGDNRGRAAKPWPAQINSEREYEYLPYPTGTVRCTREIADTLRTKSGRTNHAIPVAHGLILPRVDLPIDPYVLGAWLGDGTASSGANGKSHYILARSPSQMFQPIDPVEKLRALSVFKNKHIPRTYLRASADQRFALLQGLMDTGGTVDINGCAEFDSTNLVIAEGTYELIVSLGWKAHWNEGRARLHGRDCGPNYRIRFSPDRHVFSMERKATRQRLSTHRGNSCFHYIVKCERVDPVPMRCITVDSPRTLFLCGRSMVPTHNSSAILMGALRFYEVPGFRALLLRRTFKQLNQSLIARAKQWMGPAMAKGLVKWNASSYEFVFPSGAIVGFGYLDSEDDVYQFDSAEFQYVGYDELTSFTEWRYNYLFLRLRTVVCPACQAIRDTQYAVELAKFAATGKYNLDYLVKALLKDGTLPLFIEDKERDGALDPEIKRLSRDSLSRITSKRERMVMAAPRGTEHKQLGHIPLQMRSASNPGNYGHDWVRARFIDDGKVDPQTERGEQGRGGDPCKNGPKDCPECGSYFDKKDYERFADQNRCPNDNAELDQGRLFIPALIHENPHLRRSEYEANIKRGDSTRGAQMLTGNWDIRPRGDLFDRANFEIVDTLPAKLNLARGWDTAGTKVMEDAPESERKAADWTVGVLLGEDKDGIVYIADVVRRQTDSLGVDELLKHTAEMDVTTYGRGRVTHIVQQEPADAGKAYVEHFTRGPLRGMLFEIESLPGKGAKYVRALPMSSASKARNIKVLRGPWNKDFFDEIDAAGPNDKMYDHDDQWDAASSAFNWLMSHKREYAYQAVPTNMSVRQQDPRFPDEEPRTGSIGKRFGPGAW